ncbi:type III secretion system cytoplasmic ring protein SctQ [Ottowia thiooxydans]|uniref:type III secretion system cytoplasmic ring protein SctQ n=1 Tax=Ottowia thiooxydans TaxID=219182 RepID=UPI00048A4D74|nr:type III secretion system cytoplasmic ring protein SctQ [Ottowia thiooxydans]
MPDFSSFSTPYQPPRLSRNEAKARTTIAQRGSNLALRLGDGHWYADLRPSDPQAMPAGYWMLSFEWIGAEFHLQLPKASADQIAAPLLAGTPLPELPHELALATLEAALADTLGALKLLGRGTPQLLDMQQDCAPPASSEHTFSLYLRAVDGSAAISATLHADSLGLLVLAGLVSKRAPAQGVLDEQLLLRLPAEIGFTRLPARELPTLAPGDVVLMDTCHIGAQRVLWLVADGAGGLLVRLPELSPEQSTGDSPEDPREDLSPLSPENSLEFSPRDFSGQLPTIENEAIPAIAPTLIVIQAWSPVMPPETHPSTSATSLDGVPIRLSFDLGEVTLTVAEVRALQPGQAISLMRPLAGAVRIRANGAQVGEGDLVEIDGQLGVSIRALFAGNKQETE